MVKRERKHNYQNAEAKRIDNVETEFEVLYYITFYSVVLHHIYLFVCLFVRPTTLLIRCSTEAFRTRTPAPKTNNFELTMPLNAMVNAIMRQQKCDNIKSAIIYFINIDLLKVR